MTGIEKRPLGRTAEPVTVLGYGAMELREPPRGRAVPEADVERILNAVLDSGINLVDTSIDYGASEERIGRYLAHRRDEFLLATKCGCVPGVDITEDRRGPHDFSRANVMAGVEQSLRRLRTDRLDLVQVHHCPDVGTLAREGTLEALEELRQAGKVRFVGSSSTLPNLPGHIDTGRFDVFQIPYSALEREHEELITAAHAAGAGVIVRGGAGKGVPSGEERPLRRHGALADAWQAAGLDDLREGMSAMEFTLRFTISHPHMSTTIVGTVNPDHLRANVDAVSRGPLPADVYDEARRRLTVAGSAPVPASPARR